MAKKDKRRLVDKIYEVLNNNVSRQLLTDDFGYVRFEKRGDVIISQGTRDALSRSDTVMTYIKATHWFDSFWFYVNVSVRKGIDGVSELPFTSVSFFQDVDGELKQLFRAEWDNYDMQVHPQPHWHITSNHEDSFEDLKGQRIADEDNPFAELVYEPQSLELPKMHFAMAGNWHERKKEEMVSCCAEAGQLANWLNNLFEHVRCELAYACK